MEKNVTLSEDESGREKGGEGGREGEKREEGSNGVGV